ncbi:TRAP transporter substrate-binding protein [Phytohalomonas tamaricis]|uniref:TRAP transporter substrate-binding protein n=1 Tax=Phytohalomonas tamaricis TaxID=2081032 RepID=UPI000D0B9A76|nr:TRAP transporter substrate-binding protein [Phytohalomonas tamaricis]
MSLPAPLARFGAACSLAALSLLPSVAHAAESVTLRLQHFFPPTAPVQVNYFEPWAKRLEAQSDGRIKVQIFPSMQLGGTPASLYDQGRDGQVDMIWTLLSYTPNRFPAAEVFDLPFLSSSAEITSQAAHEYAMSYMQDAFKGMHVIAVHVQSPGLIHTRDKPVRTLSDMRGLKLRAPSATINRFLATLGAAPVGMPASQAPEALSRGVIDGTVLPFEGLGALGLTEITPYHTTFSGDKALYTTMMVFAMNERRYEALPDDLKAVIDANSGVEQAKMIGHVMDEADQPVIAKAQASNKGAFITVDEQETARWKAKGDQYTQQWIMDASKRGLDGQQLYDAARQMINKYANDSDSAAIN